MSEGPGRDGALIITTITITRELWPDGDDVVHYKATTPDGHTPALIEQLGLLAMAVDSAKESHGDDDDD